MRYLSFITLILIIFSLGAQEIIPEELPDISEYLKYYESGLIKRIQVDMPLLKEKYGVTAEIMFFDGILEENGDEAYAIYQEILKNFPESPVVEHTLFRVAQFNYAKKQYYTSKKYYLELVDKFPETQYYGQVTRALGLIDNILGVMPDKSKDSYPIDINRTREFVIQLGVYAVQNNATNVKKYFQEIGYNNIEIIKDMVTGKPKYKVWLRGYVTKEDASREGRRIKLRYRFDYIIFEVK